MIRLNIQMFGGRGGGSGGGGGGGGGGSSGKGKGSAGGKGTGNDAIGGGKIPEEKEDNSNVRKIVSGETYDMYVIKNGVEKISDRDNSAEDTKELLSGYHPDSNGIWKDRYGRAYRVVRHKK